MMIMIEFVVTQFDHMTWLDPEQIESDRNNPIHHILDLNSFVQLDQ